MEAATTAPPGVAIRIHNLIKELNEVIERTDNLNELSSDFKLEIALNCSTCVAVLESIDGNLKKGKLDLQYVLIMRDAFASSNELIQNYKQLLN